MNGRNMVSMAEDAGSSIQRDKGKVDRLKAVRLLGRREFKT